MPLRTLLYLEGMGSGDELREVKEKKTIIRKYYMRKESVFNKRKERGQQGLHVTLIIFALRNARKTWDFLNINIISRIELFYNKKLLINL